LLNLRTKIVRLSPQNRVAILLHEGIRGKHGKTGLAFLRYTMTEIVAIIDYQCTRESIPALTGISKQIPIVSNLQEALAYSPDVLLIGIAPSGGLLPEAWGKEVKEAVEAGLSLVNGLHTALASQFPQLQPQQWIWDIRQEPQGLKIGGGRAKNLSCQRILTVGTDMAIGKMSTCIELDRSARQRAIKSKFLATGQAGMAIAGEGIPLDAIRVDFAAGAVEGLVLGSGEGSDIVFIEGQGSLLHPGSTATLPLIRGSQPTGLVLVHKAGQESIRDFPEVKIPPLTEVISLYEAVASAGGAFGTVKVKAIALNSFHLGEIAAKKAIEGIENMTGIPCTDVVRFGGDYLLDTAVL
jgi:uncharacterized NAD-dependent epimerase/dehydratase family protein